MADIRTLTDAFAVAPQLRPEEIAGLGPRYALLINNRPDAEEPDQPSASEMEAAALAAGLGYAHIPVTGMPGAEQVAAMQAAMAMAEGPVLAFCRSGTRSAVTWAAGEALMGRDTQALTEAGARGGYELAAPLATLLPRLRA